MLSLLEKLLGYVYYVKSPSLFFSEVEGVKT